MQYKNFFNKIYQIKKYKSDPEVFISLFFEIEIKKLQNFMKTYLPQFAIMNKMLKKNFGY